MSLLSLWTILDANFKKIAGSEPGLCTAISVVNVLALKWQRKPQSCNVGTPKLQPRSLTWPGPEVAQLPPKSELTSPEAGQSKVRFTFYFSGSSLDTNTKFPTNIAFPMRAQACIEEIMMSSQKLKSINLKEKTRYFSALQMQMSFSNQYRSFKFQSWNFKRSLLGNEH